MTINSDNDAERHNVVHHFSCRCSMIHKEINLLATSADYAVTIGRLVLLPLSRLGESPAVRINRGPCGNLICVSNEEASVSSSEVSKVDGASSEPASEASVSSKVVAHGDSSGGVGYGMVEI